MLFEIFFIYLIATFYIARVNALGSYYLNIGIVICLVVLCYNYPLYSVPVDSKLPIISTHVLLDSKFDDLVQELKNNQETCYRGQIPTLKFPRIEITYYSQENMFSIDGVHDGMAYSSSFPYLKKKELHDLVINLSFFPLLKFEKCIKNS